MQKHKKSPTRGPCIIDASIDARGCITHGVKYKAWQEILRLNHQGARNINVFLCVINNDIYVITFIDSCDYDM